MSTMEELYETWRMSHEAKNTALANSQIKAARLLVSSIRLDGWLWLTEALNDERRKWFVAAFFRSYPVPRRMLKEMIRAGILENEKLR